MAKKKATTKARPNLEGLLKNVSAYRGAEDVLKTNNAYGEFQALYPSLEARGEDVNDGIYQAMQQNPDVKRGALADQTKKEAQADILKEVEGKLDYYVNQLGPEELISLALQYSDEAKRFRELGALVEEGDSDKIRGHLMKGAQSKLYQIAVSTSTSQEVYEAAKVSVGYEQMKFINEYLSKEVKDKDGNVDYEFDKDKAYALVKKVSEGNKDAYMMIGMVAAQKEAQAQAKKAKGKGK